MQNEIFSRAMQLIIQREGTKFTNHPADRGGPTRYGIIQREYDRYRKTFGKTIQSVEFIDFENEVKDIYYHDYWLDGKCDVIADMGKDRLALWHFQSFVNFNPLEANKLLQRALGVNADGIIGKITLGEIQKQDEFNIIYHYYKEQRAKYLRIVQKDKEDCERKGKEPTQHKFLNGWLNRTDETLKFLNITLTDAQRQAITVR